ncbi:serine hydrolase domain-containing protein [Thalassotalea ganghwensis]
MKVLSFFTLLLFASTTVQAELAEQADIDKMIAHSINAQSPGAAIGVIKNNELIFAKGYGLANLEYNIPINSKSIFRIGSTSKQFTAACIILLVQQGKLSLNDKITKFFPDFPEYGDEITVKHLLNHTSGIRDYLTLSYMSGLGESDVFTDNQVKAWLVGQSNTNIVAGSQFQYTNSGYWLLGQIVEIVSGMSLSEYAQKEIFSPLGMNNTHFHDNHKQVVKNRASGYRVVGENQYEISMTRLDMIGDGGVFSNIEDLKKWDDAFYDDQVFGDSFWQMMKEKGTFNDGKRSNYASGLLLGEHRGLQTISHGGAFVGYRAELLRYPEMKFSVIVLSNRADTNATGIAYDIATLFLKNELDDIKPIDTQIAQNNSESKNNSATDIEQFVGSYWDESSAEVYTFFTKDDTLMLNAWGDDYLLKPISSTAFYIANIPPRITFTLGTNDKGTKTSTMRVESEPPSTAVEFEWATYSQDKLRARSGKYYSEELDVFYDLVLKDDQMLVKIGNKVTSPLSTVLSNVMRSERNDGLTFIENQANEVSGFNLTARGVKNIWFKKLNAEF